MLAWVVGVPLAHGLFPIAIARVVPGHFAPSRLGWIAVAFGAGVLLWTMVSHLRGMRALPEQVDLDWKPKLFLARGPYALSRNPMYVGELALWLGWTVVYGSAALLVATLALFALMTRVVRREERDLEGEFGDEYRAYRATVPRWLGAVRRPRPQSS
jgi:protein-S-isoprenylcysteine O-methyltransferase Ste14